MHCVEIPHKHYLFKITHYPSFTFVVLFPTKFRFRSLKSDVVSTGFQTASIHKFDYTVRLIIARFAERKVYTMKKKRF